MPIALPDPLHVSFLAGRLCLDFANTADWHASAQPVELIPSYDHLLVWGRMGELLDDRQVEAMARVAEDRPGEATAIYGRAIALREAIYRVFSAHSNNREPDPADLEITKHELDIAFDHLYVERTADGYTWSWGDGDDALDRMLWPVARSLADVVTSADLERVRECAGDPCGWLFLDTSRNRSRRWCSMQSCGNRAKARRHYERTKTGREGE